MRRRPAKSYMDNFGEQAIDALLEWDGKEGSNLPKAVTDRLYEIPRALPEGGAALDGQCRRAAKG